MFQRLLVVSMLCLGGFQVFGSEQAGSDAHFHTFTMRVNGVAVREDPGFNLFFMDSGRPGESVERAYRRFQQEIQSYIPRGLEVGIFGSYIPDAALVELVRRSIGSLGWYDMDSMSQIELIVRQDSDNSSRSLDVNAVWRSAVRSKGERLEAVFTARESVHGLRQRMGELDKNILIAHQAKQEIRERAEVEYEEAFLLARQQGEINLTTEEIERLAFELSVLDMCKLAMISGVFEQARKDLTKKLFWRLTKDQLKRFLREGMQKLAQGIDGVCVRWMIAHWDTVLAFVPAVLCLIFQHEWHDDKRPLVSRLQ